MRVPGRIRGRGFDLFFVFPVITGSSHFSFNNGPQIPGICGSRSELRILNEALSNVVRVLKGEEPKNVVNPE